MRLPVLFLVAGAGVLSLAMAGTIPHDGLHPLALMAAFLPLQLAALFYVFRRPQRSTALRAAESPAPALKPPANG